MGNINRNDMLELTRRMTSARSNLIRIAGAYIDEEGYIDGTFNTSFLNLYELIAEKYPKGRPYAIYMYYGAYDVPIKGSDKAYQDESEEVYQYLILAISPVDEIQVPHSPEAGFLYPAFTNRSTDINHVNFYSQDYEEARELMKFLNLG